MTETQQWTILQPWCLNKAIKYVKVYNPCFFTTQQLLSSFLLYKLLYVMINMFISSVCISTKIRFWSIHILFSIPGIVILFNRYLSEIILKNDQKCIISKINDIICTSMIYIGIASTI